MEKVFRAWVEKDNYMDYQGEPDLESLASFMHHYADKPLMLRTPFKDCEGTEIFEGDKIGDWTEVDGEMVQSSQTVFFDEKEGQWMLDYSLKQDRSKYFALCQELRDFKYKVIGNIYLK